MGFSLSAVLDVTFSSLFSLKMFSGPSSDVSVLASSGIEILQLYLLQSKGDQMRLCWSAGYLVRHCKTVKLQSHCTLNRDRSWSFPWIRSIFKTLNSLEKVFQNRSRIYYNHTSDIWLYIATTKIGKCPGFVRMLLKPLADIFSLSIVFWNCSAGRSGMLKAFVQCSMAGAEDCS